MGIISLENVTQSCGEGEAQINSLQNRSLGAGVLEAVIGRKTACSIAGEKRKLRAEGAKNKGSKHGVRTSMFTP